MKKILIVFIITIMLIIVLLVINKNEIKMKGSDTKIAYWNFNSRINNKTKFSLAETVNKETAIKGYIAPRMQWRF